MGNEIKGEDIGIFPRDTFEFEEARIVGGSCSWCHG